MARRSSRWSAARHSGSAPWKYDRYFLATATASLGEEDQRHPLILDYFEQPVLLVMVGLALGAGKHGVVVMGDRHPRLVGPEQRAVDPADAGDQPVGRSLLDQVLDRAARALAGDREGAPFDERAGIDQVVEVLPRRALVGLAPPRHRLGPLVV